MPVGVVFTTTAVENFQRQWEFALCHFRPTYLYVHGDASVLTGSVLTTAVEITGPADLPENPSLVLLSPINGTNLQGDETLFSFQHPDNAIYWFGSDSQHLEAEVFNNRAPDYKVYIETNTIDQMFSFTSFLITMYDRKCKRAV
jgi:hypothetical protein